MRFLIDECLSVDLVSVANRAGHEAQHVAHIGKAGWTDWNVARHARDGDFVLVTNNASDFRRLYAAELLHAGLVIIIPNIGRMMQQLMSAVQSRSCPLSASRLTKCWKLISTATRLPSISTTCREHSLQPPAILSLYPVAVIAASLRLPSARVAASAASASKARSPRRRQSFFSVSGSSSWRP
jgi:predicted nuclease of predicted toxin-antitoxin system